MAFLVSHSRKICITCAYWAGSRKLKTSKMEVEGLGSSEKAECMGGGRDKQSVSANTTCPKWSKMAGLK